MTDREPSPNNAAQARRRERLHQIARDLGYSSWYRLATAIGRGEVVCTRVEKPTEVPSK